MHRLVTHPVLALAGALLALMVAAAAAVAAAPTTTRVSVSSTSAQGNGVSYTVSISADGRWAAFESNASNLVANDTNGVGDVFLRDRMTGRTTRASVGPGGVEGDKTSDSPVLSADGRYVVFRSVATTLAPGADGAHYRLYRFDRVTGTQILLPLPPNAGGAFFPAVSADGSRVAFEDDEPGRNEVWWWDAGTNQVRRASETQAGGTANGVWSFDPAISGDGKWVGFTTDATNLVTPDTNGYRDVLVKNLATGALERISQSSNGGEANLHSSTPALNYDGCAVAFFSSATNLVAGDTGSQPKVFVRDRCTGITEIASVKNDGTQAVAATPIHISDDGCRIVFPAVAVAAPPAAAGNAAVLRDRCAGTTTRLDLATTGDPGSGDVQDISISGGTGRYVGFSTDSAGLVGDDTNGLFDSFVRDLGTNTPPVASLGVAIDGQTVTVDATGSHDPDGFVLTGSITYGDGSPAQTGLRGTHLYPHGGTYGVTVTVTDADGISATATKAVVVADPSQGVVPGQQVPGGGGSTPTGPDAGAPLVLDRVVLSPRRFAVVARGRRPDARHGAALTMRLSSPATVTLRFQRARNGRKVNGRCRAGARKGARCTVYADEGTITRALPAGTSTIGLTGRLGGGTLAAGKHRLIVSASTADGRRATAKTLTLTILRGSSR